MKTNKKDKQQPSSVVTGFGSIHKNNPTRPITTYVILSVVLLLICVALIETIVTFEKKPIPPKVASFDKNEISLEKSIFGKGGIMDQTVNEMGNRAGVSVDQALDKTVGKVKQAAALRKEGIADQMTNRAVDEAVEKLRKAATDDPLALFRAGTSYLKSGRYQEALDIFNRLIALNGKEPLYFLQRGAALIGLGEIPKGSEDIERAAAMNPQFEQIAQQAIALKNLYLNTGWRPAAKNVADVATSLSKEDVDRITRQMTSPENPTK